MVAWQRGTLIKNYKTRAKRTRAKRKYTFENTALHLLLLCLLYIVQIVFLLSVPEYILTLCTGGGTALVLPQY